MAFARNRVLLAYCAGDKDVGGLNRLKVVSLSKQLLTEVSQAGPARPLDKPLLDPCLDYGRSFVNTNANWNSPRFWVESRCRVTDETANKTVQYLQCGLCKSEDTFANRQLFLIDNYDFLPVFSDKEGIIFRRPVHVREPYRDVRPVSDWWGGTQHALQTGRGRVLKTAGEIFEAMQDGRPIVGQTEIRDDESGRVAVLEYPVKTINFQRDRQDWQVDTGPVVLPDLTALPGQWSHTLRLAHIAFRTFYWADFIVDQPTPVSRAGDRSGDPDEEIAPETYHYSGQVHKATRNVLLALP